MKSELFEIWKSTKIVKTSFNSNLESFNNFVRIWDNKLKLPKLQLNEILELVAKFHRFIISDSNFKESQPVLIGECGLDLNTYGIWKLFNRKVEANSKGKFNFSRKSDETLANERFELLGLKTVSEKTQELNKTILKLTQKKVLEICNFETTLQHYTFKNFLIRNREFSYKEISQVLKVIYAIEVFNSLSYLQREEIYEKFYSTEPENTTTEPTTTNVVTSQDVTTMELLINSLLKEVDNKTEKVLVSLLEKELAKEGLSKEYKVKNLLTLVTEAKNQNVKVFALAKVQEL